MTCPHCKGENEMVFSVLSHGLMCQEGTCGFEIEMDWEDLAVLLDIQPAKELTFA